MFLLEIKTGEKKSLNDSSQYSTILTMNAGIIPML
jgi:hypothetical protein